ncbi:MAG: hypothetical protein JXA49_04355 [Actinobacteria bacterium]|nr:hypothetical protein [Actinomycetota bacterium]
MGLVGGAFCFLAVILGILVCILLYRAKTLDPDYYLLFGKPIYGFEGWSHEEKGNKLLELGQRQKHLRKISAVILWVQVSFLVMGGGLSIFVLRYYWTIYGVVYKNR